MRFMALLFLVPLARALVSAYDPEAASGPVSKNRAPSGPVKGNSPAHKRGPFGVPNSASYWENRMDKKTPGEDDQTPEVSIRIPEKPESTLEKSKEGAKVIEEMKKPLLDKIETLKNMGEDVIKDIGDRLLSMLIKAWK